VVTTVAAPSITQASAWDTLSQLLDPEVPVLSIVELGIVRDVVVQGGGVTVTVTPTYSGCPATEVINEAIVVALNNAGAHKVIVRTQLAPAWTTDWLAPEAADKLRRYGIAPPHLAAAATSHTLRFHPRKLECPRCTSLRTLQLSAFGSTACKSLYRCLECLEPFEYLKPI
jgi:ring-1,2-phenylacetyl-CoA epoxidase subunit PaaD